MERNAPWTAWDRMSQLRGRGVRLFYPRSTIHDLQSHLLRVPLRPLRLGGKSLFQESSPRDLISRIAAAIFGGGFLGGLFNRCEESFFISTSFEPLVDRQTHDRGMREGRRFGNGIYAGDEFRGESHRSGRHVGSIHVLTLGRWGSCTSKTAEDIRLGGRQKGGDTRCAANSIRDEYGKMFGNIVRRATVSEVVAAAKS